MTPAPRIKPTLCRVHTFFDGQNLFRQAEEAFGYNYPNYDPIALSEEVTKLSPDRVLEKIHFYTGVHDAVRNPFWHHFWNSKLNKLRRHGVRTIQRVLKYAPATNRGREKGIDVRIALDLVRLARRKEYDVAVIFSQDQDLVEAVNEVKAISAELAHWIRLECAFPVGPKTTNRRGINGTQWIQIDKALYDRCLDPTDYRPKQSTQSKL